MRPSGEGHARHRGVSSDGEPNIIPFELEVLEEALQIAMNKMDHDLQSAQALMQECLERLPRDITPRNLDELRRAKGSLVELESKSDAQRCAASFTCGTTCCIISTQ